MILEASVTNSSTLTEFAFPGRKIKIIYDRPNSASGPIEIPKQVGRKKAFTPIQMAVLGVMHLAVPLAFDEATGGFRVLIEGQIDVLPGGREINPSEALHWVGAVLQAGGIRASDVANTLESMYPARFYPTKHILAGSYAREKLRRVVVGFYPEVIAGKARKKPVPTW